MAAMTDDSKPRSRPSGRALRRAAAFALLGLSLAACGKDRTTTGSLYPYDYRERHPIALADRPQTLDVFVTGPHGLDARQRADVAAFAAEHRRGARSGITAYVPATAGRDRAVQTTLQAVRQVLAQGGAGSHVTVTRYSPPDPALASPIRLSFHRLKAEVAGQCGEWPKDLASGGSLETWQNRPYWNLGCAYQANLAAQVADPLDLVRARPEDRLDTVKRMNGIEKLRKGQDPTTVYKVNATKINSFGGN